MKPQIGSPSSVPAATIPLGSALDDSGRFGNAWLNCGGLLGGKDRFAIDGVGDRRVSMDEQNANTEASFPQALAFA